MKKYNSFVYQNLRIQFPKEESISEIELPFVVLSILVIITIVIAFYPL